METDLHVYIDLKGEPHLVGRLWTRRKGRAASASFEYQEEWLANPLRFALEPALVLGKDPQHTLPGRALFGAIGDSAPDRWGRVLLQREERRRAHLEKRAPHTLSEHDYLLGVSDFTRSGALRFAREIGGAFLAPGAAAQVPPLVELPKLLNAAMKIGTENEGDEDLRLLLAPGSSLGGARPKASVVDKDGQLMIAKFPQSDDTTRVPLWEATALKLASLAGITTHTWWVQEIAARPVLLLRRFDRTDKERIPFLSAMSMLNAIDNEPHSYMELADALRRYGSHPEADCAELWRRIVFNVLISNADDHLRNHGFLYDTARGWRISPAYDLNPVPLDIKPRILSLAIDEADDTASLDVALSAARHFGLKPKAAHEIAREVGNAVAGWRKEAAALGLKAKEIDRMQSAFEHEDLKAAVKL